MSDQWFVHSNGEQMGPYTGEQLVQYAQEGSITAETMVWADGMPEWAPASQVPGLIPQAAAPVTVAAATTSTAWAPPGSRLAAGGAVRSAQPLASSLHQAQAPLGGEYPQVPVKPASFGLWLGTFLGGFVCTVTGIILIIPAIIAFFAAAAASSSSGVTAEAAGAASFGVGVGIMLFLGFVASIFSTVLFYIYLYRAWFCLRSGAPQTTPGKAVGFLFIPLFQLYWMFVAIKGLSTDWNRVVSSYEDLKTAPRLNETTFLLFCIGVFIAPLALVMMFPMMSQLCKGINFFAARRNSVAASGYSALGGR